jgi:sec-independent protein translocase protein TatB
MFNMPGGPELLVIFVVALIVIGPQQLPKAMRTFGNVMAEVRKVSSSFQAEMKSAMDSVVETSGDEKPQSGTMATPSTRVGPAPTAPTEVSDDPDEVVARNHADPVEATDAAAPADPDADAPTRPAVDPADRAAG